MTLSEKIYACRKQAGLSQDALAEKLGVSRQAVSKWETGEATPEVGKLLLLARAFGVTTDWLLSEEAAWPPADAAQKDSAPEPPAPASPTPAETWVDHIPGMIGQMIRRFGWIYGIMIMGGGMLFMAFGALIRSLFAGFFGPSDGLYVEGIGYLDTATGQFLSNPGSNPGGGIGTFVIGLGAVIFIAGLILTIVLLYKRNQQK